MSITAYGVNDPEARKAWSKIVAVEALDKTYIGQFIGKGDDAVIQEKGDLNKDKGDSVRFFLRAQLVGRGVQGDAQLKGNEEKLTTYADDVVIDQRRHAASAGGRMSRQRVPFNVRRECMDGLSEVLNAGRFDEVPAQFARFVNADGKKMKGLVRRRAAEAALWHEGDAEEVDLPSSVTRSSPTPPTLMDAKPLNQSKSFWAAGVAACAGVSAAIEDVTDAVSPFAWHSETVGRIVSLISLVGAVAAIATVVFLWLKKRRAAQ